MLSTRDRARELRRNATGVEAILWSRLRLRQLDGHKFRRQVPIGPYFADFACLQQRLIIEIDGPRHDSQIEGDEGRDAWLAFEGYTVLRFAADHVLGRRDEVVEAILNWLGTHP